MTAIQWASSPNDQKALQYGANQIGNTISSWFGGSGVDPNTGIPIPTVKPPASPYGAMKPGSASSLAKYGLTDPYNAPGAPSYNYIDQNTLNRGPTAGLAFSTPVPNTPQQNLMKPGTGPAGLTEIGMPNVGVVPNAGGGPEGDPLGSWGAGFQNFSLGAQGLAGLASAYTGYQNNKLARRQFDVSLAGMNRDIANQSTLVNKQLRDQASVEAQMAGNAYGSQGYQDYKNNAVQVNGAPIGG